MPDKPKIADDMAAVVDPVQTAPPARTRGALNQRAPDRMHRSRFYAFQKRLGHHADFLYWHLRGKPVRSPHLLKQRTVAAAGREYRLHTLVEVGTYYGEMVAAVRKDFQTIHTIEYDQRLFEQANSFFAAYPHIHVAQGDSQRWIPKLLEDIKEPCLFWLDGGYFFWANKETDPNRLKSEISAILSHGIKGHVVLLDDARRLNGEHQSPRIKDFMQWIESTFPDRTVEVRHDIVRITPRVA